MHKPCVFVPFNPISYQTETDFHPQLVMQFSLVRPEGHVFQKVGSWTCQLNVGEALRGSAEPYFHLLFQPRRVV